MNITLLGNCQTLALTWYLQELNSHFNVVWIQFEKAEHLKNVMLKDYCKGKLISIISDINKGIERLKCSDYIIYQPMQEKTSPSYNYKQLKKYAKKAKLISISSMWNPANPKFMNGMIERAKEFNIDIPAHKIIERHGSNIKINDPTKPRHPNTFYFLELIREICIITGWDYYSNEQYNKYLKEAFPFG
tara:strand:+ start:792 stop:1358 length:567 start_codon:yes stop_codon:yes gene_type:complete